MVILRSFVAGVILCSGAVAQKVAQQAHLFDCREMDANLEKFTGQAASLAEFQRQLTRVFEGAGVVRLMRPANNTNSVYLVGTNEQVELTKSACAQLCRPDLQELRVQCTVLTMPLETATAAGLQAGKVLAVDEAKAGQVLKDAVAAKGRFRNLPEGGCLPLQPFLIGKPAEQRPGTTAETVKGQLRIEALPLSAAEAWFALQWSGELPGDGGGPVGKTEFEAGIRLKVGSGAMVMSAQGKQAVVLWVRFPFTRDAKAPKDR